MPAGRQGLVASSIWRFADDPVQAAMVGALTVQACIRASRSIVQLPFVFLRKAGGVLFEIATDDPGFTVDEPKEALANAIKLAPWYARRAGPGSSQRWRRFADRRRGKASLRRRGDAAAKFFPVRGSRNLFLLSARGHEAIMTAREEAKETKRS